MKKSQCILWARKYGILYFGNYFVQICN